MNSEHRRQFIHLSGLVFVLAAQILGGLIISLYSFMIAFFFLFYSFYLRYEKKKLNRILRKLDELETKLRNFTFHVARTDEVETKFLSGPFWLFLGFGTTFLIFPLHIASAACAILAIGDVFSNLIGSRFGKTRITGNRTAEGSVAFLVTSFVTSLFFVSPIAGLIGAFSGTVAEIYGKPNDNLLIPLFSAFFMLLAIIFLGINGESIFVF